MLPVLPFRRDLQRLGHQTRRATRCSLGHRQQPTSSPHIPQRGPSKFLPRPTPRFSLTPHPSWTRSTAKNSSKTADGTNDQAKAAKKKSKNLGVLGALAVAFLAGTACLPRPPRAREACYVAGDDFV